MASYLLGIKSEDEINVHFAKGVLFENYIINEYIKDRWNQGKPSNSYFWRDSAGNEIDLLIDEGQHLKIIEIKSSKTIKEDFFKHMNRFSKLADKFSIKKYLVYGGSESLKRTDVQILSWDKTANIK